MTLETIAQRQRDFFETGATLDVAFRRDALRRLHKTILDCEPKINAALQADLNKSPTETFMCETGMTLSELSFVEKHLGRWAKDRRVLTPMAQFHARSFTVPQP